MICTFVGATLEWDSEKQGPNPLVREAGKLSITGKREGDMKQEDGRGERTSDHGPGQAVQLPDTLVPNADGVMEAVPVNAGEAPVQEAGGEDLPEGSMEGLMQLFQPR
jgi:hypothetical protein